MGSYPYLETVIYNNFYEMLHGVYLASAFAGVIAPIDKEMDEGTLCQMVQTFDTGVLFLFQ